jgi:hypothetical protein
VGTALTDSAGSERFNPPVVRPATNVHAATAVGRGTRGFFATTTTNHRSQSEAESSALSECLTQATDCQIVARFSGPGSCVYVAGGQTVVPGHTRAGTTSGGTEADALAKCHAQYDSCRVFHTQCNRP